MFLQGLHQSCYSRSLLTNGYINTIDGFSCLVEAFLIDNSINSNSRFTCLTVADNKLTLPSTNRNH